MDSEYRPLTDRERCLIEKLLTREFVGRDELLVQLRSVVAKQIFEDGTLALLCDENLPAPVKYRAVSEGECRDVDGMGIIVLLHVNAEGFMHMLEILRYDSSPIISPPNADELEVY